MINFFFSLQVNKYLNHFDYIYIYILKAMEKEKSRRWNWNFGIYIIKTKKKTKLAPLRPIFFPHPKKWRSSLIIEMATSAFKSTSKRGNLNSSASVRTRDSSDSTMKTTPAPARKRSSSVSAVSRAKSSFDISNEFSNKRENPLFWSSLSSPTDNGISVAVESTTKKGSVKTATAETNQRGRSVTRNSGVNNGIGRSVSRVSRRSVSRGHYSAYEVIFGFLKFDDIRCLFFYPLSPI